METPYKRLREQTGLSQSELAVRIGMATQQYNVYESGKSKPTVKTVVRVARVLAKELRRKPASVLAELTEIDERQPVTAA